MGNLMSTKTVEKKVETTNVKINVKTPEAEVKRPIAIEKNNSFIDKRSDDKSISIRDRMSALQSSKDDGHYETLDGPLEESEKSPEANRPTVTSSQRFKIPKDTKTKVDPFAANYDTLRMMPDVDWEKKENTKNDGHK